MPFLSNATFVCKLYSGYCPVWAVTRIYCYYYYYDWTYAHTHLSIIFTPNRVAGVCWCMSPAYIEWSRKKKKEKMFFFSTQKGPRSNKGVSLYSTVGPSHFDVTVLTTKSTSKRKLHKEKSSIRGGGQNVLTVNWQWHSESRLGCNCTMYMYNCTIVQVHAQDNVHPLVQWQERLSILFYSNSLHNRLWVAFVRGAFFPIMCEILWNFPIMCDQ